MLRDTVGVYGSRLAYKIRAAELQLRQPTSSAQQLDSTTHPLRTAGCASSNMRPLRTAGHASQQYSAPTPYGGVCRSQSPRPLRQRGTRYSASTPYGGACRSRTPRPLQQRGTRTAISSVSTPSGGACRSNTTRPLRTAGHAIVLMGSPGFSPPPTPNLGHALPPYLAFIGFLHWDAQVGVMLAYMAYATYLL